MKLRVHASDTQIFISWDEPFRSVTVYRQEPTGEWYRVSGVVKGGTFVDSSAIPLRAYRYRIRYNNVDSDPSEQVWIQPLWGWNTKTQTWAANDRVNRPTFRARILDATRRLCLTPELVSSATLTIYSVLDNDVTAQPRWTPIAGPTDLLVPQVLLPNLIVDEGWDDLTGFNFRHCPSVDLEPGDYAFRYTLNAGDPILVHFRYKSVCREA